MKIFLSAKLCVHVSWHNVLLLLIYYYNYYQIYMQILLSAKQIQVEEKNFWKLKKFSLISINVQMQV